ncbi:MAG TPA: DUF177 domain-containing protein [Chryseolinea sp.]|nr:DUF177 domain-containing protein [Chryseolinea sp.]
MGAYRVNIVGLSNKVHHFHYEIGGSLFQVYGTDLVSDGTFEVDVSLDKRETFLEADFSIRGTAHLICDRSLEPFDYPINMRRKVVFKYGDQDEEITDEIIVIQRDAAWIELGQYLYEFIALGIPLKKLHPRFQEAEEEEDDDSEGKIVYSSGGSESADGNGREPGDGDSDDDVDPRWNALKKLK